MLSYKQFRENKETDEEKTGLDTDHDNERGESKEHQDKFKKKHKEMLDFFHARKEGAAKIARESAAKGTPAAQLTAWHFKAKHPQYIAVIQAIESGRDESFFMTKCKSILSRIHCGKMTQENFQKMMGEAEVWGEALAHLFKGK
jgi:hypothetical protein